MSRVINKQTSYGFGTTLNLPYEQAVDTVKATFKEEGFGTLTEIDVKKTLKEKIGEDFRKYTILGVCNPHLAHRAFSSELEIGLLLPCNVIVYEQDGQSVVKVMDPIAALGIIDNREILPIAEEAKSKLERAINRLQDQT